MKAGGKVDDLSARAAAVREARRIVGAAYVVACDGCGEWSAARPGRLAARFCDRCERRRVKVGKPKRWRLASGEEGP